MRRLAREYGVSTVIDSAGTHDYHVGKPPDIRAQAAARRRGYDLGHKRARQIEPPDFERFDSILCMDFNNLERLQTVCPDEHQHKLGLLMPFAIKRRALIVHDPYCRSAKEFSLVLDYIEDACQGLIRRLVLSEVQICRSVIDKRRLNSSRYFASP